MTICTPQTQCSTDTHNATKCHDMNIYGHVCGLPVGHDASHECKYHTDEAGDPCHRLWDECDEVPQ